MCQHFKSTLSNLVLFLPLLPRSFVSALRSSIIVRLSDGINYRSQDLRGAFLRIRIIWMLIRPRSADPSEFAVTARGSWLFSAPPSLLYSALANPRRPPTQLHVRHRPTPTHRPRGWLRVDVGRWNTRRWRRRRHAAAVHTPHVEPLRRRLPSGPGTGAVRARGDVAALPTHRRVWSLQWWPSPGGETAGAAGAAATTLRRCPFGEFGDRRLCGWVLI